jgi:hypothetical protein
LANRDEQHTGGRGGIRTHGTLSGTPVFKTGSLNHSDTLPLNEINGLIFGSKPNWHRIGTEPARSTVKPSIFIGLMQHLRDVRNGSGVLARGWPSAPSVARANRHMAVCTRAAKQRETVGLHKGGRPKKNASETDSAEESVSMPTLRDAGIEPKDAHQRAIVARPAGEHAPSPPVKSAIWRI